MIRICSCKRRRKEESTSESCVYTNRLTKETSYTNTTITTTSICSNGYITNTASLSTSTYSNSRRTVKDQVDMIGNLLGIKRLSDWRFIRPQQFQKVEGASELFQKHKGSLLHLLQSTYPEELWQPWWFGEKLQPSIWRKQSLSVQREYFDLLMKELQMKNMDEWYTFPIERIREVDHCDILDSLYKGSVKKALVTIYSDYEWKQWHFSTVDRGYWKSLNNQKMCLQEVGDKLKVKSYADWYNIKGEDVIKNGGAGVLREYNDSLAKALMAIFPEFPWKAWKFLWVPHGYWNDINNQLLFFDWLAHELIIEKPEDWRKVTLQQVIDRGGAALLAKYHNSLIQALNAIYPSHNWKPKRKESVPKNYWNDISNQRKFFEDYAKQKGILQPEDWYNVRLKDIHQAGGIRLISMYGGSLIRALSKVFPEYNLKSKRSPTVNMRGRGFWNKPESVTQYLNSLAEKLNLVQWQDWYTVPLKELKILGAGSISYKGGLKKVLPKFFPEHKWETRRFLSRRPKVSQGWLKKIILELFPNTEVKEDYLHPHMKYSTSSKCMELDLFLPSLNLAFEYNGIQHYEDCWWLGARAADYERRGQEKAVACANLGITLIQVPYWWDYSKESLIATLRETGVNLVDTSRLTIDLSKLKPIPIVRPQINR